jgi:hypothetical protein
MIIWRVINQQNLVRGRDETLRLGRFTIPIILDV